MIRTIFPMCKNYKAAQDCLYNSSDAPANLKWKWKIVVILFKMADRKILEIDTFFQPPVRHEPHMYGTGSSFWKTYIRHFDHDQRLAISTS